MFCKNVNISAYYYLKLIWSDLIKFEHSYARKCETVKNGLWNKRVPPLVLHFFDFWPKIIRSVLSFSQNNLYILNQCLILNRSMYLLGKKIFRPKNPWNFCQTNPVLGNSGWRPTSTVLILFSNWITLWAFIFKRDLDWIGRVWAKLLSENHKISISKRKVPPGGNVCANART